MNVFFSRTLLTLGVLALLGGCSTTDQIYKSWFGGHVQDADEAPVPDAAPAEPVEAQPIEPQSSIPAGDLQQVTVITGAQQTPATMAQKPNMPLSSPSAAAPRGAAANSAPAAGAHNHTKVGILLPLTGKNAALGKAMLNAAQMAVFDMSGGNFELMPRDTGASDASAAAAARDAISNGAQLLIGPLFATQVASVREVAANLGVNILTLSTDTSLAAPGIFVMGFAPGAQVERVVNYAVAQGIKRFAALVPDNAYGQLVGQTFQLAVARTGAGVVVDIESYNAAQHGAGKAIAALAAKQDQIEALFLPEGDGDLEKIAGQLATAGFDHHHVKLLGTGLWDEPELGQRAGFLVGGWYAASDPAARRGFVSAYNHAYGQEPPRLTTLSYDATALAAVLSRRGLPFDRAALTNPNGFAGVDGIFRLTLQGLVERGLAINEVTIEGAHTVSAAPTTFAASTK